MEGEFIIYFKSIDVNMLKLLQTCGPRMANYSPRPLMCAALHAGAWSGARVVDTRAQSQLTRARPSTGLPVLTAGGTSPELHSLVEYLLEGTSEPVPSSLHAHEIKLDFFEVQS
jgi:hypothetical protein